MTSIKLTVTGAQAWALVTGPLTSGMVGIPVTIEYDEAWDGLTKNLMCRCSPWNSNDGENRAILNVGENASVAHEVMQPDRYLYLGVEGFSDDGTLVIPTTWASCGKIEYGANTCEDPSADPELSVWNQLQTEMEQIKEHTLTQEQAAAIQAYAQEAAQSAQEARQAADEAKQAANVGGSGLYYTPLVTQPTSDTLKFEFKPSVTGAPIPKPVTVELPVSEDSDGDPNAAIMIRAELSGCDLSNPAVLHASGTAYETEIRPRDHHVVGSVYVEVGGVDVTKDVYDADTDTISISAPVADVLIEAFCPERQPEKTVDLVLFSGQSNMSGRGDGSQATVCPEGEGYWYKDGGLTQITGYFGNESNSTGSMVSSVAKAYYDACGVPIVAVSFSSGGTKIAQFAPGETFYQSCAALYNEAAAYLEAQGYTIRHKAMVWCQGESDGYDGTTQADYEAAFISIRDGLKADCGITEFFMVEIGQYKTDLTMYDEIKAAQEHLTDSEPDIIMASRKFIGATGLMKDVWHYTQPAYNLVGRDTGVHMAYYYATGIRPRVTVFSAADVTDQDTPVVSDELDAMEWDYTLYEDKGIVGLNQYLGSDEDVTVKAQYKVNGITYNTALDRSNKTGSWGAVFKGNTTIKTVTFEDGVMWTVNGTIGANVANSTFEGCTALQAVTNIPPMDEGGSESYRSAQRMYYGCTAVVSAPAPENVMDLSSCWENCAALTECAALPDTATKLTKALRAAGIVNAPDVPDSATTIQNMCSGTNNVESVGAIGSGVTNMQGFCPSLKLSGVVRIEAAGVTNMTGAFSESAIPNITFEVPAGSTTYATLIAAFPEARVTVF